MSRITGGVFSKPSGKTGGVVFGAARSRTGKITTVRALVPPSNPNTAAQQTQRGKFSACQDIVRRLGPTIYQSDFNRAIGQLPGFQSLNSIFLNQMNGALALSLVTPINLGTLHFPSTLEVNHDPQGTITVTFSTENGSNGTANDIITVIAVSTEATLRDTADGVLSSQSVLRSAGSVVLIASEAEIDSYQLYVYVKGAGLAAGFYSVANPYDATV